MDDRQYINPAVVIQTALGLTIAILCTDAVRSITHISGPDRTKMSAAAGVVAAVITIILVSIFLKYYSVCEATRNANNPIVLPVNGQLPAMPVIYN